MRGRGDKSDPEQAEAGVQQTAWSLVPPRVRRLIYLTSFSSVAYGYLIIAITAYLPEAGMSSGDVGLLIGVNGLVFVVSAIPIGLLADKKGRKNIFLLGLLGIPPSIMVYAFTDDLGLLLIAAAVAGVCEGAFASSWNALIADMTTVGNRTQAFSISFIVGAASFGIGFALPFMFPPIQSWLGITSEEIHSYAFILVAFLSALSPALLWPVLRNYREELKPRIGFVRGRSTGILLKFSGVNSLLGLGAGFIIPLIPTWMLLKFGVTDTWSGPLLAASNISIGFAAIASTRLAARFGMVKAVVLTQGTATIFMLSLAFVPGAVMAAGIYLVRGALMNMDVPILDSMLMGIVTKEERGFASALNSLMWRLPNSITTVVGGEMLERGEYELPFYVATGFYTVSIVLFYKIFRNVKVRDDDVPDNGTDTTVTQG